jgi:hypothetical protein
VNILRGLPVWFVAHRGSYWRLGYRLLNGSTHMRDHIEQISRSLAAARR